MKRLLTVVTLAASFAFAQTPPAPPSMPGPKPWDKLAFGKLGEVKLPPVKRYTLSNGMKLFLVEDHSLPIVDGSAMIHTGSRWIPAEKIGMGGLFGTVMRSGGTKSKTGDELDEALESIAAQVETSVGVSSGGASFSAQKGDVDKVLAIYADVLMHPEFRQDKIDLAKLASRTGISRRNDDPSEIARREFRKVVYGAESPYAAQPELWTVDAITRADLMAFHQRYYHPNNMLLSVWGDFNAEEMKAKIEKAFGSWPSAKVDLPPIPQADPNLRASITLIKKDDVNQSNIRIGHQAGRLDDPDFFAADVMSTVLCSGGFSSRMMRHIRTEMGLAYSASGDWSADYDHNGVFVIGIGTKSESTSKAIEAALKDIREIREKEVSDEELKVAKESILNLFVFNFEDVSQVINRMMTYEYYGYPADYLEKYKANVEKVTKADVLRVAQRRLQPTSLGILVVGKDTDFDAPLDKLAYGGGKVTVVDVAIKDTKPAGPAGPGARPAPPAASGNSPQAVLDRALKFFGGVDKLKAVKDVDTKAKAKITTPQGEIELELHSVNVYPWTSRSDVSTAFGDFASYYDGNGGWATGMGGATADMDADAKKEAREGVARGLLPLLTMVGNPTLTYDKRDGDDDVLLFTVGGYPVRLWVAADGKVVKRGYHSTAQISNGDVVETLSDYRDVGGIQYPYKTSATLNGIKYLEAQITEMKVNGNPNLAKLAEKPK